jgi:hypothetical protein
MQTRKLALSLAAVLVLALVAPVVGQPFADVPTNHWAYDAIAELAAKGLVEGFPDGTFKGNQPLTRYEMAMIVARIIARIEAIPTPPPPEVRRADLDAVRRDLTAATGRITANAQAIATLQRLVNEFRAELQALGVRVTALEEELSALRARLDNTRITGIFDTLYVSPTWSVTLGGSTATSAAPGGQSFLPRIRLTYTGTVAPGVSVTMRVRHTSALLSNVTVPGFAPAALGGYMCLGFPCIIPTPSGPTHSSLDFDRAYLTISNLFDVEGLSLKVGRDAVNLGPIGLLLNETLHNDRRDGVYLTWKNPVLTLDAFAQWEILAGGPSGRATMVAARATFTLLPGWTLGVNFRSDNPQGDSTLNFSGSGIGASVEAQLLDGLKLTAEYAGYTNSVPYNRSSSSWQANLDFDLATLLGIEATRPRLTLWYRNLDDYLMPVATATAFGPRGNWASPDFLPLFAISPALSGWGARLELQLLDNVSFYALGEWATLSNTPFNAGIAGRSWTTWEGGLIWTFAPKVAVRVFYTNWSESGPGVSETISLVGAHLSTSW